MILSRYFDKGDYGTYKQVLYVYSTLLTIFLLGLPRTFSYFLPRVPIEQAKGMIDKLNLLLLLAGTAFSVVLFLASNLIASWMNNADLAVALRLFSPVPLLMLPTQGLEGVLSTYRKTQFMAIYTVLTRVLMLVCVALPVVIWNCGYKEAIIGFDIASLLMFLMAWALKYYPVRHERRERCQVSYKEIWQFALPLLLGSIWGLIINSADAFFVSRWFGKRIFAEFSNGAMELPFVGMIVAATTTVLSPIFSRMSSSKEDLRGEMFPLWKSAFAKSGMLIYPILLYCIFFADTLMAALYGEQYRVSGIYFQIKNLSLFFSIIAFGPLLINVGKVKLFTRVHFWCAVAVVVLEFLCVEFVKSPVALIGVSTMCRIGLVMALLVGVARYFGTSLGKLFPPVLWKILALSVGILAVVRGAAHWVDANAWIVLIASGVIYVVFYLAFARCLKIDYWSIVKPLLDK